MEYNNQNMKRIILGFSLLFFALSSFSKTVTPASSLPAYYADVNDKSGKALFDQLQIITKVGFTSLSYSDLWNAYQYTDLRDNGQVWDMYSDCD